MKYVSKMNAFIVFWGVFFLIYPAALWASTIRELPIPKEISLTSERDIPRHLLFAEKHLKTGKFNQVIAICEQVLSMKQNQVEALSYMAAAYKGLGDEEAYQNKVRLIKKLAPESPSLYLALANTHLALKEMENAKKAYQQGLVIAPDSTKLRMGLAALFFKEGRIKKAEGLYLKILEKKGLPTEHFLNANFALCRIGLQQKAYESVIKRAGTITDLYPPLPQGHRFLASAYLGKGQPEKAIEIYKELIQLTPQSPVPSQGLALIYSDRLGDYKKALDYAREAVRKAPRDPKSQDVLGWVYYRNEKYQQALKQFQAAVNLMENNPRYLYHLGLAHQRMGENIKAKDAFEQSLRLLEPDTSTDFAKEVIQQIDQCR